MSMSLVCNYGKSNDYYKRQHYIGLNGVPEGVPSLAEYLADYCAAIVSGYQLLSNTY
ncbi:hypothetical protein ACS0TY_023699 [Phlomoides rotata]